MGTRTKRERAGSGMAGMAGEGGGGQQVVARNVPENGVSWEPLSSARGRSNYLGCSSGSSIMRGVRSGGVDAVFNGANTPKQDMAAGLVGLGRMPLGIADCRNGLSFRSGSSSPIGWTKQRRRRGYRTVGFPRKRSRWRSGRRSGRVEGRFHQGLRGCYPTGVRKELQEKVRRRVGGSPSRFPPLSRLAALWRNALLLRGGEWKPQLMMEPTFEKLLVLLADAEVNVVLVGGVAVTLHG